MRLWISGIELQQYGFDGQQSRARRVTFAGHALQFQIDVRTVHDEQDITRRDGIIMCDTQVNNLAVQRCKDITSLSGLEFAAHANLKLSRHAHHHDHDRQHREEA